MEFKSINGLIYHFYEFLSSVYLFKHIACLFVSHRHTLLCDLLFEILYSYVVLA